MQPKRKKVFVLVILLLVKAGFFLFYGIKDNFEIEIIREEGEEKEVREKEEEIKEDAATEDEKNKNRKEDIRVELDSNIAGVSRYNRQIPGQIIECSYSLEGVPSPKAVSFSPDGLEIWATSLMNKERGLFIFNAKTGKLKENVYLDNGGGVEIVFNRDGSKGYVSQMETGTIFEIDTESKKILRRLRTESIWTKVVVLSNDERLLFASNWSGNDVSVIDLDSGVLLYNIPTVETPRGIYVTEDGNSLYVAGFKNGEIEVIDLNTKKSRIIYRNGGAMRDIVGDEESGYLYISDMANASIYRINIEKEKVEKFVDTDQNPNTIELTKENKVLIVSNRGINNRESYYLPGPEWGTLQFFNIKNGEILDAVVGGNQPTGLSVYQDSFIYSNFLDGSIVICDIPSYEDLIAGGGGASHFYKDFIEK